MDTRFRSQPSSAPSIHVYDAHAGTPGQIAYGIDDLVPNEETRDHTVSLRLDDSRGANYQQQFTFGFQRLADRYNDNEPYGQQPLAALVQNVAGPPAATYFIALVNPNAPPTVIPPGLTLVQTTNYFGGDNDSLNITERKIAGYQGTLSHRGGALVFGYDYQDQSGVLSGVAAVAQQSRLLREPPAEPRQPHFAYGRRARGTQQCVWDHLVGTRRR